MADATEVQAPDREKVPDGRAIERISADIRNLVERSHKNIDKLESEGERTDMDKRLCRVVRTYEPILTDADRKALGRFADFDRGDARDLSLDNPDPSRQREAARVEAEVPRSQSLEDRQPPASIQQDERATAALARLSEADKAAEQVFRQAGMNVELAMNRVSDGANYDAGTREKWLDRDILAHAQRNNISDEASRAQVESAYKAVADVYREARGDIQLINREFEQRSRGSETLEIKGTVTRKGGETTNVQRAAAGSLRAEQPQPRTAQARSEDAAPRDARHIAGPRERAARDGVGRSR